jgi:hypothetical protein
MRRAASRKLFTGRPEPGEDAMRGKTIGRWVVYERRQTEFIHLSKPFRTKEQAEKERSG